jgi:hypothetical protein
MHWKVKVEMSNELLVKPQSSGLRFYRKALRGASKKTHRFSNQAFYRRIDFSEDDELGGNAACDLPTR